MFTDISVSLSIYMLLTFKKCHALTFLIRKEPTSFLYFLRHQEHFSMWVYIHLVSHHAIIYNSNPLLMDM